MKALVVFESMFGDNETIANAIADGLRPNVEANVIEVGHAPATVPADIGLLIVGGPNHAAGMSRPSSRESAAKTAGHAPVSGATGLREWLAALGDGGGRAAVAFDSRLNRRFARLFDRASRGFEKGLRKAGFRLVARAEHFYVQHATGPLLDGEADRAREWGRQLATEVAVPDRTAS